jgi:hypothetical protein
MNSFSGRAEFVPTAPECQRVAQEGHNETPLLLAASGRGHRHGRAGVS